METMSPGFAYTIATGNLYCSFSELHEGAEALLGSPIFTHEFADQRLWQELRSALEDVLKKEMERY